MESNFWRSKISIGDSPMALNGAGDGSSSSPSQDNFCTNNVYGCRRAGWWLNYTCNQRYVLHVLQWILLMRSIWKFICEYFGAVFISDILRVDRDLKEIYLPYASPEVS